MCRPLANKASIQWKKEEYITVTWLSIEKYSKFICILTIDKKDITYSHYFKIGNTLPIYYSTTKYQFKKW